MKPNTNRFFLHGAIIVIATLIAYWPALHGGFIWDDDAYVTRNPMLTAPDGLERIWFSAHSQSQYFPLVYTTFRLEHALWGLNPFGYHLVNILLHSVNALLVWAVLRRLAVPGAWLAAAIFALHPVQVESAAWVTELKNLESTFFYFLALLAWMKFVGRETHAAWRFYVLAIIFYALALFSKTTACTLPAALVLVLWLRHEPVGRRRAFQIAPFVVMGVIMGLVSIWWESHLGNYQARLGLTFSGAERVLIASRAIWFYLGKVIWPVNLTFSYPRWQINPQDPLQYFWLAACLAAAAGLWWWRQRVGRGTIAALVFFAATLLPLLGFVPLYTFYFTFVADHYQYLACLGPIALMAAGLIKLAGRWNLEIPAQRALVGVFLLTLGTLTWLQAGAYKDLETLWRDTLSKHPRSWMAHTNLGIELAAQGRQPEAEEHYRAALQLKADNPDTHYNFGNLLLATGRTEEAAAHYEEALRLNPTDADVHNNLATILFSMRRMDEAIAHLQAALQYKPELVSTHYNLGVALEIQGRKDEAIRQYQEVLRLQPDSAAAAARLRILQPAKP